MNDKIYLLTGGTGNLGSNISKALIDSGERVRALVRQKSIAKAYPGVEIAIGDVLDQKSLEKFFEVEDELDVYVIHCASIVTMDPDFSQFVYDVNVTGTQNIIDQCVNHNVKKLVYISSTGAIPELPKGNKIVEVSHFNPEKVVGYYSVTKALASQMVLDAVKNHDLDASLIHPSGIFGPYDFGLSLVTQNVIDVAKGKVPFGIEGTFNAVDVRDLAAGIISCCEKGRKGECYILSNETATMMELYNEVTRFSGAKPIKLVIPIWLARIVAFIGEVISKITGEPALITTFMIYNLVRNNDFDSSKAKKELGFSSRPFFETIKDEVAWLKDEGLI